MAKKVVATLKTGTGKQFTKCIKMVKSEKTGSYMFKEGVIANDPPCPLLLLYSCSSSQRKPSMRPCSFFLM